MKVSVIVPVFNTEPYLVECLDSLLAQDMPSGEFEIVAVDDGSTDGSGRILDDYADRHGRVRVLHQENSGWPGRPRNVGIEAAKGEYVFFADSDDRLGPEALRRMVEFADAHGSDVVVPRHMHFDGRPYDGSVWRANAVDADLRLAILTVGPWKLFRRDFLDRRGLRFPEGKIRLEDGIFVTEAYLTARRVSVLTDSDYYYKREQPDRGNISKTAVEPWGYTASVARMMMLIRTHCADATLADAMVTILYRRKGLRWFEPGRFARFPADVRSQWVAAAAALAEEHVPVRLDVHLPLMHRIRSTLVRAGETEALRTLSAAQDAGASLEVTGVTDGLDVRIPGLTGQGPLQVLPGLRLAPGDPIRARRHWTATAPGRAVRSLARERILPLALRTGAGRRAWAWAGRRVDPLR